jgi:hypothetical protein
MLRSGAAMKRYTQSTDGDLKRALAMALARLFGLV